MAIFNSVIIFVIFSFSIYYIVNGIRGIKQKEITFIFKGKNELIGKSAIFAGTLSIIFGIILSIAGVVMFLGLRR